MNQLRVHGGASREEVCDAALRVFIGMRCALGRTLVMPLMLLWREYSKSHDATRMTALEFREALDRCPWAAIEERGGRGKFRTVVLGVGLRP